MAKKKFDERTVEVPKGDDSYRVACEEVKRLSGFDCVLGIRGRVVNATTVEYEFLVGPDEGQLKSELFRRQMEAERSV